ncbi:MAG: hypothetical protein RLZZ70_9 [Candidatus Parcubacteria bacterium]|jgi:hypothetical protein
MSEPKQRELDAVSKIPVLENLEVTNLHLILCVLGFDIEITALFWEKTESDVRKLFCVTDQNVSKVGRSSLTGQDLAWWCNLICLKPGVVQRRYNFDESPLRQRKQGRSSTRVPASWIGPPMFATKGSVLEGRAVAELSRIVSLPTRSVFSVAVMDHIMAGKHPIRLPLLRDLMTAIEEADIAHPKVDVIKNALAQFPKGVRTPDDVLEVLTKDKESTRRQKETSQQEEFMRIVVIDRFRKETKQRRILPVLQSLYGLSAGIRQLYHQWSIDVHGDLFPGHLEVIVSSEAFLAAAKQWPELTRPIRELGEWLLSERSRDKSKVNSDNEVRSNSPELSVTTRVILPNSKPGSAKVNQAARPVLPNVKVESVPVAPLLMPKQVVSTISDHIEIDEFGVVWNWTKRRVEVGSLSMQFDVRSDVRLQGTTRTVSKRVYDSLCTIRIALDEDWQTYCRQLGVQPSWVSDLVTSKSQLSPMVLKGILAKLRVNYKVDLNPPQLFGLASLPTIGIEEHQGVLLGSVIKPEVLLYPLGDSRAGYRWASLLQKYRAVLKWFRQNYGVTDTHIVEIEEGKIGVPLPVHLVLMWKVKERIEGYEGVVIPRSYEWFLNNPQSKPVQDGSFVLDESNIPNRNWLCQ